MTNNKKAFTLPCHAELVSASRSSIKGFTLLELLVVVLIIGILAAVALPQYQKAVEKARATEAITVLENIRNGIDAWVLSNGTPKEKTHLVGCADTDNGKCELLDIDVESALTCDQDYNGARYCRSKYFAYYADCFANGACGAAALRRQNGDTQEADQFVLTMGKDSSGTWSKECWYYGDTPAYAKSLCEGLETQGWFASDEE